MADRFQDMNDLARRASNLLLDVTDLPRHLRVRLGPHPVVIGAAEEMVTSLEALVRELRRYHEPISTVEPLDEI